MTSKKEKVLDPTTHDLRDPNPWLAMYLDSSIPMNDKAKQALVLDNDSRSGKWLMPFIIVWSKITIFFIHIFKFFFPRILNSSKVIAFHGMMTNLASVNKKKVIDMWFCDIKNHNDYKNYRNAFYEFKPKYNGYNFIIPSKQIDKTIKKLSNFI